METKSNKGIKGIITLAVVFVLCIALVLATTLGDLSARKTATGTITFDLADYDFQVTNSTESVSGIYPNKSVTTKKTTLINTDNGEGATAGLSGVYVRLKFTGITIGDDTFSESVTVTTSNNKIIVSATKKSDSTKTADYLEIELDKEAGTGIQWGVVGSENYAYLVNSSSAKTTLAFSKKTDENKTSASVKLNITGIAPEGATNGFNATSSTKVGLPNKYQGKNVSINYAVEWGTTIDNIGKKTTTA